MSYFQELDAWLTAVLLPSPGEDDEEQWFARVKKQIKEKILESYHNGQKAGLQPKPSHKDKEESPREPRKFKSWPPRRSQRQ